MEAKGYLTQFIHQLIVQVSEIAEERDRLREEIQRLKDAALENHE